jgi:DNA polymerase-3 subunit gamma/tau
VRWQEPKGASAVEVVFFVSIYRTAHPRLGLRMAALDPLTNPTGSPAADSDGQYIVVARRYRPQTFAELIGQEHVARALTNAIEANRVGHAYLFTGARGVGKTSAARILAKALNCVHGPSATPCNQCDSCESISAGSDVDVLEIDGASNRGIDEIRQLRQNVNIRPSRARFKIYIIDEVHMLTREAFNALLKTLEEPPDHVKFIFCTTEANKIPITILSRCQRFDFAGIHLPSIVARLAQIVEAEGIAAEPEALAILARRANGSMRDSQSLLEQLLAFGERKITAADVHAMLGTAGEARLADLMAHLAERNLPAVLADLDAALAEGVDVGQLLEQLLGSLRDGLTAAIGCPSDTFLHTSPAEHPRLSALGRQLGVDTILAMMQIIDHTLQRLRLSTQGRTLAEMALVRIANLSNLEDLQELIARMRAEGDLPAPSTAPAHPSSTGAPRAAAPATTIGTKKKTELIADRGASPANGTHELPPAQLHDETVASVWKAALASLSDLLADNAGLCESVRVAGPARVVVAFRAKYTSGRAFCERPEQLAKIEAALAEAAGGRVQVEFTTVADEPSPGGPRRAVPQRMRMAEKAEHPMVRKATELFDAHLVRIEEPDV